MILQLMRFRWFRAFGLLPVAFLPFWLVSGQRWVASVTEHARPNRDSSVQHAIDELRSQEPSAAAALDRLRERHDARALAAVFDQVDHRGNLSGLRQLAEQAPGARYQLPLAELALDPQLFISSEDRESFLVAHGSACQILDRLGESTKIPNYLARLRRASADRERWQAVKNDAMALLLWDKQPDSSLRAFYLQEEDWLAEILVQLAPLNATADEESNGDDLQVARAVRLTETARRYHPLPRQAVVDLGLGTIGFQLFLAYGEVINAAVVKHGLALDEVLEVIYANSETLDRKLRDSAAVDLAAKLALVRQNKPSVWKAARQFALALKLDEDAPQYADELLSKYGSDDIANFLYTEYPELILPAAAAIHQYGDLAICLLNEYADEEPRRFDRYLTDPQVGIRLIPYVAQFRDQGLDRLEQNRAWIDKYFDAQGKPKDAEWWTQIPGGAAASVARNWARGYPSEWNELGWAALDVADAALLVASMGTSSVVTVAGEAAKSTGKTTTKILTKKEVRALVANAGRGKAQRVGRNARKLARNGVPESLLRRVLRAGKALKATGGVVVAFGGRLVREPAQKFVAAGRQLLTQWKRVPEKTRRLVYRSLLAVGLIINLNERTIPAMGEIGAALGNFTGDLVNGSIELVGQGLANALNAIIEERISPDWIVPAVFWSVTFILGLWAAAMLFRLVRSAGRGKVKYV